MAEIVADIVADIMTHIMTHIMKVIPLQWLTEVNEIGNQFTFQVNIFWERN